MSHPYSAVRIRASLGAMAVGKALSAPLTFVLLLVLAWAMDRGEYARYVASTALLEIAVVLGTFGIEWVTQTAVAGVLVQGNAAQRRRLVWILAALPCAAYALIAALLWLSAERVAVWLGPVFTPELVRLYAAVLALEGPMRMVRDSLMAALMQQRAAQAATVLRVGVMLSVVFGLLLTHTPLSATAVAWAELAAAAGASVVVLVALVRTQWRTRATMPMPRTVRPWLGRHSVRFAGHAYGSLLLMLLVGTDVMIALVARYLGADMTAALGFVVRLIETLRRYLPMDLFWGVLRPAVLGRYESHGRDGAVLTRDGQRMVAMNGVTIALAAVVVSAGGETLLAALGRGQVLAPAALFLAMLPLLATHTLRRTLELVAYVRGHSVVFVRAALWGLAAPLLCAAALQLTGQVYSAPLSIAVVDVAFVAQAVHGLRARGEAVPWEAQAWLRLALVAGAAAALGFIIHAAWPSAAGALAAMVLSGAAFTIAVWRLPIIAHDDLAGLRARWRARRAWRGAC